MSRSFASRLALARAELDRDHDTRSRPIAEILAESGSRVVLLHGDRMLFSRDHGAEGGPAVALLDPAEAPAAELAIYLGRTLRPSDDIGGGAPIVALVLGADAAADIAADRLTAGTNRVWRDLRTTGHALSDRDAGLFTEALGMANWHVVSGFAPTTGRATDPGLAGWVRVDPETGKEFYPRTDAAIIVGIVDDDDRMLLGSNATWPEGRYSVLAGFVEPGESLEQAVAREVFEESGLTVAEPRYLGSQPWPFPASLMVGFLARLAPGSDPTPRPDGEEIVDLRWFTREEMTEAAVSGSIRLPGPSSIARAILAEWHGGDLGPNRW